MASSFIVAYWYVWIVGLVACPALVAVAGLGYVRAILESTVGERIGVVRKSLNARAIAAIVVFGMGTFVSFVLFAASVLLGMIAFVKSLFV